MIVSAVCHGPSAFLGVEVDGKPFVQDRKLTSFSTAEEDGYARDDVPFDLEGALRAEGALFESTDPWQPEARRRRAADHRTEPGVGIGRRSRAGESTCRTVMTAGRPASSTSPATWNAVGEL